MLMLSNISTVYDQYNVIYVYDQYSAQWCCLIYLYDQYNYSKKVCISCIRTFHLNEMLSTISIWVDEESDNDVDEGIVGMIMMISLFWLHGNDSRSSSLET